MKRYVSVKLKPVLWKMHRLAAESHEYQEQRMSIKYDFKDLLNNKIIYYRRTYGNYKRKTT